MKVTKEIDLVALQLAIFGLSATKAKAVLDAVGVQKSDLEGLESVQNQPIEPLCEEPVDNIYADVLYWNYP